MRLILLLVLFSLTHAQTSLLTNLDTRDTRSLDGRWAVIVDPYENGYYNYRYEPSQNGYFRNEKQQHKGHRVEYAFAGGDSLNVPGDWNSQDQRLFFYEGTVWYQRYFEQPKLKDDRLFLYFGAANYAARVYVNGNEVAFHRGGFTPFNVEITDQVVVGENSLVVKVDNRRHRDAVPTLNTDWWNYGGITRSVSLIRVPQTFIRDFVLQIDPQSPDHLKGFVQLDGTRLSRKITVHIPEMDATFELKPDESGLATVDWELQPKRWSPDAPKLYEVVVSIRGDEVTESIGFRTIETDGTHLLLNGEPLFLRGISLHEEAPLREGRAHTLEDARQNLDWIQELGGNFVRLAHYPHNEAIIREAEKRGILVWSEIPVYWTILFEDPAVLKNAQQQLTEMITRDRNRANVIIWSVANETPRGAARLDFLTSLIDSARVLDPTRLISAATELERNGQQILVNDPLASHLDVVGANEYFAWYTGDKIAEIPQLTWTNESGKPLIISELGAGAKAGFHGDSETIWTEEFQAEIYRNQIAMLKQIDFLVGVSPWILRDFRSPRRPLPDIQDFWNRKGLISDQGEYKQAFGVLQAYYRWLISEE